MGTAQANPDLAIQQQCEQPAERPNATATHLKLALVQPARSPATIGCLQKLLSPEGLKTCMVCQGQNHLVIPRDLAVTITSNYSDGFVRFRSFMMNIGSKVRRCADERRNKNQNLNPAIKEKAVADCNEAQVIVRLAWEHKTHLSAKLALEGHCLKAIFQQ